MNCSYFSNYADRKHFHFQTLEEKRFCGYLVGGSRHFICVQTALSGCQSTNMSRLESQKNVPFVRWCSATQSHLSHLCKRRPLARQQVPHCVYTVSFHRSGNTRTSVWRQLLGLATRSTRCVSLASRLGGNRLLSLPWFVSVTLAGRSFLSHAYRRTRRQSPPAPSEMALDQRISLCVA